MSAPFAPHDVPRHKQRDRGAARCFIMVSICCPRRIVSRLERSNDVNWSTPFRTETGQSRPACARVPTFHVTNLSS
jgi:hypothetical protein